jgi:hypothetical protein
MAKETVLKSSNVVKLYHSQVQHELDAYYRVKKALMLWGTFGIGKSFAIKLFAQRKAAQLGLTYSEDFNDVNDESKFLYLEIILHQFDPAELKGLPFASADRSKTVYLPMGLLPEKGQGIIFFDELNLASPMLQNNAYQIIQTRRLGFYKVPTEFISIGAGNLEDDRGHTIPMAMPLNNRFGHIELNIPAVDDLEFEYRNEKGRDPIKEVIPGWITDFAIPNKVDHRIINYLKYQQNYLYMYDPDIDDQKAVATPRTWANASDMISDLPYSAENEPYLERRVGEFVGDAVGNQFVAWLALSRDYDLHTIYKTEKVDPPTEVDYLYSLTSALVGYYQAHSQEKNAKELAVKFLHIAEQFKKEHTAMMLSQMKVLDPSFFDKIRATSPEDFKRVASGLYKLLV